MTKVQLCRSVRLSILERKNRYHSENVTKLLIESQQTNVCMYICTYVWTYVSKHPIPVIRNRLTWSLLQNDYHNLYLYLPPTRLTASICHHFSSSSSSSIQICTGIQNTFKAVTELFLYDDPTTPTESIATVTTTTTIATTIHIALSTNCHVLDNVLNIEVQCNDLIVPDSHVQNRRVDCF